MSAKYTATVEMISTEYTYNGETLPCGDLMKRISYSLIEGVNVYSTVIESVQIEASTVKALYDKCYAEMSRMNDDIAQMNQEYRAIVAGISRTK
jgi:hypothetical protein